MSNVNVENLLYDAIGEGFEDYRREELGSETRKIAHNETMQMMDRAIELERIESEREEKAAARKSEEQMKERQMAFDKKKEVGNIVVGVVMTGIQMLFTGLVIRHSMRFEKTDTITSTAGKEYMKRGLSWMFKK